MNSDIIQGKWKQIKGQVKQKWGELTDDELDQIDGKRDELVGKIARDPSHRRLLGMAEITTAILGDSPEEFRNTLSALGQRGHVVFRAPGVSDQELSLANTFHAGVGAAAGVYEKCHLILDPDLMDHKCIAHIIGDVFLEWLHCEMRRNAPIQDIR